jgi:hypothetical protein
MTEVPLILAYVSEHFGKKSAIGAVHFANLARGAPGARVSATGAGFVAALFAARTAAQSACTTSQCSQRPDMFSWRS